VIVLSVRRNQKTFH